MDLDDDELRATRMMNGADRKGRVNKMEQDIDKIINDLEMALLTDLYGHITTLVKKEDLEHLIKAYKELEEENKDLKNLANNKQWISPCYVAQNYIPTSLVEETIEELIKEGRHYNANKIEVLQELLERGNRNMTNRISKRKIKIFIAFAEKELEKLEKERTKNAKRK